MTFVFSSDGRVALRVAIALGLLVRLVIFWHTPALGTEIEDEQHYVQLASNIVDGDGFAWATRTADVDSAAALSGLLAAIFSRRRRRATCRRFGSCRSCSRLRRWRSSTSLAGGSSVPRRAGSRRPSFWLYPSYVFFNFTILTETLFTLLLIAFVLLSVMLVQTPRRVDRASLRAGAGPGRAHAQRALAAAARSSVRCWRCCFARRSGRASRCRPPCSPATRSVVGPWAVRNTRLQGVVTIVDTMGGMNLRMGNYEHTPDDRMWDAGRAHRRARAGRIRSRRSFPDSI